MRTVKYLMLAAFGAVVLGLGAYQAAEKTEKKADPKYTIKEVMAIAHTKEKLRDKVASGSATDEEKAKLIDAYTALSQSTPPKGDEKAWKEKTEAIVAAAKKGDGDTLKKLTDCKACHSEFKK